MSVVRLACLLVLLLALPARAGSVTVVATGDADLQATLAQQVEAWLRGRGHTVGTPLTPEATTTLLNCMVMDDQGCARGVVEAQAKSDTLLFTQAIKSRSSNATVLIVYWFIKGKEPIGMRRACEECSPDLMRSTLEEMLGIVMGASNLARGRLALASKPSGMTVLLDNENIGVTPLEREVPAGQHTIVLMHRGRRVGERTLKIHADVTAEILMPVTLPADPEPAAAPSRVLPGIVIGTGAAAVVAGAILYFTSEVDDGTRPTYRDSKPAGIGIAAGGIVVAGIGTWLWIRAGNRADSAPTAALTSQGGIVGWSRAF